jgi:hypothetical protein
MQLSASTNCATACPFLQGYTVSIQEDNTTSPYAYWSILSKFLSQAFEVLQVKRLTAGCRLWVKEVLLCWQSGLASKRRRSSLINTQQATSTQWLGILVINSYLCANSLWLFSINRENNRIFYVMVLGNCYRVKLDEQLNHLIVNGTTLSNSVCSLKVIFNKQRDGR